MMTEAKHYTDVTTAVNQGLSTQTIAWLNNRGLDEELAQQVGLRTYVNGSGEYVVFPYGLTHKKYRSLTDKHDCRIEGGGGLPLFNAAVVSDATLASQPLLITEGELDCLAAIQSGHVRSVSVPNGAKALSDDNIQFILDHVGDAEDIIIAQDNDEPGREMLAELSARLGKSRCKYLTYPKTSADSQDFCKDLNEVLQLYGTAGVQKTIAKSAYISVPGLYKMGQLPDIPRKKMYSIGIAGLDKVKIRLGEWSVFSGIPGHGKSTFMTDWACNMAKNHKWKTLFASFEHPPQEDHKINLQKWYLGKDPSYANANQLAEVNSWIDEYFTFCYPDYEQDVSIEWLFEIIETSVKRYGTKLVIIDPWNMIDHENNEMEVSKTQYVGAVLREFRRMAYRLNIHLCIVAHPTKMQTDKDGNYAIPTLYNISDSANWNNMCNVGFIIHRSDETDIVTLRVEKCKYGSELGLRNRHDFTLKFSTATNRYMQYEEI